MLRYSDEVNFKWQRSRTIAQYKSGLLKREDVCDAEFLLCASANFHGEALSTPCPICEASTLYVVPWVYGEALGRASGSARSLSEAEQLVDVHRSFTMHSVEVCTTCRWNHLLYSWTLTRIADEHY
ncbi:DUF5318 family protein [Corynebacterium gerontici]|uniref:Uncharacterized protein n=1 Tax=Corynebacterium gerontici TaxID=2079234 RepID=A0A3G6J373_9CORY|nr:DUF5318 family protein [Corynebacterium gerontici]AZA12382.1 hypothetical protein CGERO_10515 [Corynebacterium gerontici]